MGRRKNAFVDDMAGASDGDDYEDDNEPNEYMATQEGYTQIDYDEDDIDDLDITQVVRKDLKKTKSHIADAINAGSDTQDETEDEIVDDVDVEIEDDIEVTEDDDSPVVRRTKAKAQRSYIEVKSTQEEIQAEATRIAKERKARIEAKEKADYQASLRAQTVSSSDQDGEAKVDWDSENEDGLNEAYLAFRDRKSRKRKRVAAANASRKARATTTNTSAIKKGKQPANSVVGLKPKPARRQRKEAIWRGPQEDESDEDILNRMDDEHLPDYLQTRMTKFKAAHDRIGNAALKLPPTYDDVDFSDDERMDELLEKPSLPKLKPCADYQDIILEYSGGIIPAPIAQWLREYQVKGAQFLHEKFVLQEGAILGDDMGLGKTIQVISFLTAAFGKTADERDRKRRQKKRKYSPRSWYPRVLIICPTSLFANWKEELDRWGWWDVYTYHGAKGLKSAAINAATSGSAEIMITSYSTYMQGMGEINMVEWDCVIADEFHLIKNRTSETTRAMAEINALCRIGLTGTAIQNGYDELFTLLNWTNPGTFGSLASWRENISIPLKVGQSHNATEWQLGTARKLARSLVDNLLPRFFLRRMKSLIADQLPKKSDRVVFCPLTDTQSEAYADYVSSPLVEFMRGVSTPCECGSGKTKGSCCSRDTEEFDNWRRHVFPTIMTLQKMCNHMALIIPDKQDKLEKQEKDVEHLKMAFPNDWRELYNTGDSIHHLINEEFCGKWKILQKLLQFWHTNGDKVLIFSHSVRLLRSLRMLFDRQAVYNVSNFDGSMKLEDRDEAVHEFNSNPRQFIFLISTKAGGVGLNIPSANKVVIFDPNWNPAYDQQAQDRAYRIGQTRDVEVFRLISAGTIEEIVYARQIYKQQQANIGYTASSERRYFTGIQDDPAQRGEIFGLANMFSYQGEGVVLQQIVNKTNVAESRLGLQVTNIDMSQIGDEEAFGEGEGEDAAMKELEALITKGESNSKTKKTQKLSPVQAILANAGVSYTHENSEVVGTSRTEAHLSRKAAEAAATTHEVANRPVFGGSQLRNGDSGPKIRYKYNPPEDVRMRQFCEMARMFGFKDAVEFALVVEEWTQSQRRECLEKFYRMRRDVLLGEDDGKIKAPPLVHKSASTKTSPVHAASVSNDDVAKRAAEKSMELDEETTDDEL